MVSLKTRLLATVAMAVVVSLIALALASTWSTQVELRRWATLDEAGAARLDREMDATLERLSSVARAEGVDRALEALRSPDPSFGHGFLLLSERGELLAASDPRLEELDIAVGEGALLHLVRRGEGGAEQSFELRVPSRVWSDGEGRPVGVLRPVPLGPEILGERRAERVEVEPAPAIEALNRRLIFAVATVGLITLAMLAWMLNRLFVPVAELTDAASALARGDRQRRVPVRGDDEVTRLAETFNHMADALQRTDELRRRLVADVAHELRTPLTNLRCRLEAAQDGMIPWNRATLDGLHEDVGHLQRLVSDLQELALAESGRLRIEPVQVSLLEEIETAVEAWDPGRNRIVVQGDSALQARVDPVRLRQIFDNLLSNALRHSPDDSPVEISCAQDRPGSLEMRVIDHGPGVPPEVLPHLFDRFYRTDAARDRSQGGAGLGLAIVKQWVELHGGRVRADPTEPGPGLTVVVQLPEA